MKVSNGRNRKNKNKTRAAKRKTNHQILPALVAVGGACGLAAAPVSALELGEIRVDSTLGQPLRASIAYALNPNEQMFDFCIFLKPGMTASGLPGVSNARVTITDGAIVLTGRTPIREPLLAMQLSVNCPYTAHLARDYTLMIDPALPTEGERVALSTDAAPLTPAQTTTVTTTEIVAVAKPTPVVAPRVRPQDSTPIAASERYLVQRGDSLSQIASRIENRPIGLWPAVDAIFAANPDAFLNNDINLLKAGNWLVIPELVGGSVAAPTETRTVPQTTVVPVVEQAPISSTVVSPESTTAPAETAPVLEPEFVAPAESTAPELRPGDVVVGTDAPFVVPVGADEIVDIPDTAIEAPPVSQPAPVIAVTEATETGISNSWSWLMWLGGTGLALILALLMFGRQFRKRFGSVAVSAPAALARRREDAPAAQPAVSNVDFDFDDETIGSQAITLDADLDAGTGLQAGSELDVAQDFGFTATGGADNQMDLEITEEASREEELLPTDVIPPSEQRKETILESEVLPSDDDVSEDYDMSMMIDATKHILEDNNATAKDLKAVALHADDDDEGADVYTLNKEVDYQNLEQDYEDEMTATQALNTEIEKAARELAERMDDDFQGDTAEMPESQDPEITAELTANLPTSANAQNEDFEDTGVNPAVTAKLQTADGEITIEMESGRIDTKKFKAS